MDDDDAIKICNKLQDGRLSLTHSYHIYWPVCFVLLGGRPVGQKDIITYKLVAGSNRKQAEKWEKDELA